MPGEWQNVDEKNSKKGNFNKSENATNRKIQDWKCKTFEQLNLLLEQSVMKSNRGFNFKYSNDEMKPTKWNKIPTVISSFTTNSTSEFGISSIDGRLAKEKDDLRFWKLSPLSKCCTSCRCKTRCFVEFTKTHRFLTPRKTGKVVLPRAVKRTVC